jgi:hypothetical protein
MALVMEGVFEVSVLQVAQKEWVAITVFVWGRSGIRQAVRGVENINLNLIPRNETHQLSSSSAGLCPAYFSSGLVRLRL